MKKGLVDGTEVDEYQLSQVLAMRIQDIERSLPTAIPYKSLHDHHNDTLEVNSLDYLCFTVVTSVNHEYQVFPLTSSLWDSSHHFRCTGIQSVLLVLVKVQHRQKYSNATSDQMV